MTTPPSAPRQCGRGGPCPATGAWELKHGLISPKEAAWARTMPVENAADKASPARAPP